MVITVAVFDVGWIVVDAGRSVVVVGIAVVDIAVARVGIICEIVENVDAVVIIVDCASVVVWISVCCEEVTACNRVVESVVAWGLFVTSEFSVTVCWLVVVDAVVVAFSSGLTVKLVILKVVLALKIAILICTSVGRLSTVNSKSINVRTEPGRNQRTLNPRKEIKTFLKGGSNSFFTFCSRFLY